MSSLRWLFLISIFSLVFMTGFGSTIYSLPAMQTPGVNIYLPVVLTPLTFTSEELIDHDLAAGKINYETSLIYKIFALNSDSRLPAEYRGVDSLVIDSFIQQEVLETYDTLSPSTQAILAPFLKDPTDPESWYQLTSSSQVTSMGSITWAKEERGNFVIWYPQGDSAKAEMAKSLADEIESHIWPELFVLMGRDVNHMPIPDENMTPGVTNKLDIFLDSTLALEAGPGNILRGKATTLYTDCKPKPSYVRLKPNANSAHLAETAAHELMHSIQMTYDNVVCMKMKNRWVLDGTAEATSQHLYHDKPDAVRSWQGYASYFMNTADLSLDAQDPSGMRYYGSYLFFEYLIDGTPIGSNAFRLIYENMTTNDSLKAIDLLDPEGFFKKKWADFSLSLWNREPVMDDFERWDWLTYRPPALKEKAMMYLAPDQEEKLLSSAEKEKFHHLSTRYYVFKEFSDHARSFVFYPPTPLTDGIKVTALINIDGVWRAPEDWTNKPEIFCRQLQDEQLDEVVIILSNALYQNPNTDWIPDEKPIVNASNIACKEWNGSADATIHDTIVDQYGYTFLDVTLNAHASGVQYQIVRPHYDGRYFREEFSRGNTTVITWTISGKYTNSCTLSGTTQWTSPGSSDDFYVAAYAPASYNVVYRSGGAYEDDISFKDLKWITVVSDGWPGCPQSPASINSIGFLHTPWLITDDPYTSTPKKKLSDNGATFEGNVSFNHSDGEGALTQYQYSWSFTAN